MIKWVKIDNIEVIDSDEDVYDIELEKNHYFAANGIVSHNCRLRSETDNRMFSDETFYEIEDEEGNIRKVSNKETIKVKNLESDQIEDLYIDEIKDRLSLFELI